MEYYSAIERNSVIARKWMELEIMLNEISHTRKDKYHVFSHT
jgi:hypothetical protein